MQVATNGAGIGRAADRQNLFQQRGGQVEGDQRGPFGLQREPFWSRVLGEQPGQRAEGLARPRVAATAVKTRTDQWDGAKCRAELDLVSPLAQLLAPTECAAFVSSQKARRLGRDHSFLDAGQHSFGLSERQADRLQPAVSLVELQNLILTDHAVIVCNNPERDLDTHARPKGCLPKRSADPPEPPSTTPDLPCFDMLPTASAWPRPSATAAWRSAMAYSGVSWKRSVKDHCRSTFRV
jgi:hypothetical protein